MYGVGESDVEGIEGFQVALLKAFINIDRSKKPVLCRDFEDKLKDVCGRTVTVAPTHLPKPKPMPKITMPPVPAQSQGLQKGICGVWGPNRIYTHCHLKGMRFKRVNLSGSVFSNVVLHNARFFDSTLIGTDFGNAKMDKSLFKNCNLTGANFSHVRMARARFVSSKLENMRFDNAFMDKSRLDRNTITKVSFTGARLKRAEFNKANLTDVDFSNAIMDRAEFEERP